jgi:hypothetical protein
MLHRIGLIVAVRLTILVADRARRLRRSPDAGMETADKILWAAAITIVVGLVGGVFKDKLKAFADSLTLTLGWK